MRFATTLVGPNDAEDVVATAWLRSVGQPGWPAVANKRAYLFRAVTTQSMNYRRTRDRRTARELRFGQPVDDGGSVHGDIEALLVLNKLSVRQRAAIWMTYWLDAGVDEVADVLGSSRRTIERDLHKAKKILAKELA